MKKILAFVLALVAVLSLGGCMTSGGTKTVSATDPADPDKISYKDYACTLDGLCQYLDDLGYMVFDYDASKDEAGTSTIKMQADLIGAENGYKSTYTYDGANYAVEAYYYSDTASEMYKQAKSGTFTLAEDIEDGTFEITVNGSFALVVNVSEDKPERKADIIKAFNEFYPEG